MTTRYPTLDKATKGGRLNLASQALEKAMEAAAGAGVDGREILEAMAGILIGTAVASNIDREEFFAVLRLTWGEMSAALKNGLTRAEPIEVRR